MPSTWGVREQDWWEPVLALEEMCACAVVIWSTLQLLLAEGPGELIQ
jgi:hypothetical protein